MINFALFAPQMTFTQNLGLPRAQGSAVIYSLIETAKANNLDPYRYLTWVLTNTPMLASSADDWATALLPAHAPDHCRST